VEKVTASQGMESGMGRHGDGVTDVVTDVGSGLRYCNF
jgi:hypothetical protein